MAAIIKEVAKLLSVAALVTTIPDVANASTMMASLNGTCLDVRFFGRISTIKCAKSLNIIHPNGRSGFYFVLDDDTVITFSGRGSRNQAGGSTDVQAIDMILLNNARVNNRSDQIPARGSCTFSNPFRGIPTTINCRANTARGIFEVKFAHDGSQPQVTEIP